MLLYIFQKFHCNHKHFYYIKDQSNCHYNLFHFNMYDFWDGLVNCINPIFEMMDFLGKYMQPYKVTSPLVATPFVKKQFF